MALSLWWSIRWILLLAGCALAAGEAARRDRHRPTVTGNNGIVSCTHHLACDAGVQILQQGGNALGGGGLMFSKSGEPAQFLDFREEAPASYHPNTFCRGASCETETDPGCDCSAGAWISSERCTGGHTTGVPGVPAMIERLYADKHISLPLSQLAKRAIELAEVGFPMYDFLHRAIAAKAAFLCRDPAARDIFLRPDCSAPVVAVGELFVQPLLAATLRRGFASSASLRGFYDGPMAAAIIDAANNARNTVTGKAGVLTSSDLSEYKAVYRAPVQFSYRSPDNELYVIHGAPMPFSGALTVKLMLKQLEKIEFGSTRASLGYWMDVQNAAFSDRNFYMADSDFVDVPVAELLSEKYSSERFMSLFNGGVEAGALQTPITHGNVSSRKSSSKWHAPTDDHGTSHMSISDAGGMVVSMTTTVNWLLGSRVSVPGTGVLLNNQLCDFDSLGFVDGEYTANRPDGARKKRRTALPPDNTAVGGKRPRSSMTPIIVRPVASNGKTLAMGAPGGSDIISGVANVLRNVCGAGFVGSQLQTHTDAPRVLGKNEPNVSGWVEREIFDDPMQMLQLQQHGYTNLISTETVRPYALGETFSRVQSVMVEKDMMYGASDDTRFPECAVRAAEAYSKSNLENNGELYHTSATSVIVATVLSGAMVALGILLWSKTDEVVVLAVGEELNLDQI